MSVAISPSSISFLITSGADSPSDSATSLTVAPDWIGVIGYLLRLLGLGGQVGLDPRRAAPAPAAARRRLLLGRHAGCPARGLGVDHHAAPPPAGAGRSLAAARRARRP